MKMNLKGFIVGNGATDWTFDVQPVFPELVKYFNLIPESVYKEWNREGCTIFFNGTITFDDAIANITTCNNTWNQIMDSVGELNWYDLYRTNYKIN